MIESNDTRAERISESDSPVAAPLDVRAGDAASAAGRAFLLREFGDEQNIREAMRKPGRPPRSAAASGTSPTVRGRVPQTDYEKLSAIRATTGKTESELVREGIAMVIGRYSTHTDVA